MPLHVLVRCRGGSLSSISRRRSGLDILSLDESGQERVKQLVLAQADVFESQGKLRLPPEPLRGVQQVAGILRRATQFQKSRRSAAIASALGNFPARRLTIIR